MWSVFIRLLLSEDSWLVASSYTTHVCALIDRQPIINVTSWRLIWAERIMQFCRLSFYYISKKNRPRESRRLLLGNSFSIASVHLTANCFFYRQNI